MNTRRNDFDSVYDKYSDCGFLFFYNKRISRSHILERDELLGIPKGKGNSDNIFVTCRPCRELMDFVASSNILDGWWVCPCCGARMKERTAYTQLYRENEEFISELEDDDFDEFYE